MDSNRVEYLKNHFVVTLFIKQTGQVNIIYIIYKSNKLSLTSMYNWTKYSWRVFIWETNNSTRIYLRACLTVSLCFLGHCLKLPDVTIASACVLYHRFISATDNHNDFDLNVCLSQVYAFQILQWRFHLLLITFKENASNFHPFYPGSTPQANEKQPFQLYPYWISKRKQFRTDKAIQCEGILLTGNNVFYFRLWETQLCILLANQRKLHAS